VVHQRDEVAHRFDLLHRLDAIPAEARDAAKGITRIAGSVADLAVAYEALLNNVQDAGTEGGAAIDALLEHPDPNVRYAARTAKRRRDGEPLTRGDLWLLGALGILRQNPALLLKMMRDSAPQRGAIFTIAEITAAPAVAAPVAPRTARMPRGRARECRSAPRRRTAGTRAGPSDDSGDSSDGEPSSPWPWKPRPTIYPCGPRCPECLEYPLWHAGQMVCVNGQCPRWGS
jgi:hypothetical protein